MSDDPVPLLGRTERKREAILAAATALFLRNGFHGTSMDEVAAGAAVSKQTVYKQFVDKERLFREIVQGVSGNSDGIVATITTAFGQQAATTPDELERRLTRVARAYLDGVLQPQVLALRRLIIAEAEQFPDLARAYYDTAPARGIDLIADRLAPYVESGLLVIRDDLRLAAAHLAYLALAVPQDRAMFAPTDLPSTRERNRLARAAARVFLAAYGGDPQTDRPSK